MRIRLAEIVRRRSYGTGVETKLASGRTSNFYFNMKPTMLDPEGAWLIGALIVEALRDTDAELIGGLEMGAVPIAAAVAAVSHARGRPLGAFFVRKQAKEHGTQSLIEGLPKGETLAGRKVVVVEDVTTTGGSAIKAAEQVLRDGAEVVCVLTIVDRQEGAADAFRAAGLAFRPLLTRADFH
jgi:orotate phosphoribosyltransferase